MAELQTTARQPQIDGATEFLAVIGDPIAQARSPGILNPILAAQGRNVVLVPLHVKPAHLGAALDGLRMTANFRGAIITMPHKETVVNHLDEVLPEGAAVSACNAVRRTADDRLVGTTLDGEGFIAGVKEVGLSIAGKRIFLAGAGGAGASVAFALAKHGAAAITLHNRTRARAEALAKRLSVAWPDVPIAVGTASPAGHDWVVNATALGMSVGDPLPCDPRGLTADMIAAEAVVSDTPTPFLRQADALGCRVHPGIHMLTGQMNLMIDFILG